MTSDQCIVSNAAFSGTCRRSPAMEKTQIQSLIKTAAAQRAHSYAPYSGYRVGAALLASDGTVYTGCNVENAAYGPSICAERTAVAKAVSEGARSFRAICIAGGRDEFPDSYSFPCGVCRQTLREFCDPESFLIIVAKNLSDYKTFTLAQLLPESFGPENLA